MCEQVAHRDFPRHIRIGKLDARLELGNGIVERQLAAIGEHGHEHGGERLGRRHVAEARVHRHRIGFTELADAVASQESHGVVFHDDDRETGDAPVAHRLRDVGIETAERSLLLREDQQE